MEFGYPEARFLDYFVQVEAENNKGRVLRVACLMLAMINVLTSRALGVSPEDFWDWQEQSSTYETEVAQRANEVYESLKVGNNIMNYSMSDVMEPSFGLKLLGMITNQARTFVQGRRFKRRIFGSPSR
jgi:hypothetical protein